MGNSTSVASTVQIVDSIWQLALQKARGRSLAPCQVKLSSWQLCKADLLKFIDMFADFFVHLFLGYS